VNSIGDLGGLVSRRERAFPFREEGLDFRQLREHGIEVLHDDPGFLEDGGGFGEDGFLFRLASHPIQFDADDRDEFVAGAGRPHGGDSPVGSSSDREDRMHDLEGPEPSHADQFEDAVEEEGLVGSHGLDGHAVWLGRLLAGGAAGEASDAESRERSLEEFEERERLHLHFLRRRPGEVSEGRAGMDATEELRREGSPLARQRGGDLLCRVGQEGLPGRLPPLGRGLFLLDLQA
jgi:hypothetical protein